MEAFLFAAMAPLEGVKYILSRCMSKKKSKFGRRLKVALIDIKRAHLKALARRKIYINLPDEDAEDGMCGKLNKSM